MLHSTAMVHWWQYVIDDPQGAHIMVTEYDMIDEAWPIPPGWYDEWNHIRPPEC